MDLRRPLKCSRHNKKERPLSQEHFLEFENCYGKDPNGYDDRTDQGEEGRFRRFHISEIKDRGYKLDITWLKDNSIENADELPEPEELAGEAITELEAMAGELRDILRLIDSNGNGSI
jgi:type I restriction enzyme M protein